MSKFVHLLSQARLKIQRNLRHLLITKVKTQAIETYIPGMLTCSVSLLLGMILKMGNKIKVFLLQHVGNKSLYVYNSVKTLTHVAGPVCGALLNIPHQDF